MTNELCNDECTLQLDVSQFEEIYDLLDVKVRGRLDTDYDCKKINGTTYAATWASMMGPAVGQILGSLVSIQTKETAADRCVKEADCSLKAAQEKEIGLESGRRDCTTTIQTDEVKIESSRRDCVTKADCVVKEVQAEEIKIESQRKDELTKAEHKLKSMQSEKVAYEKAHILPASVALTKRQICGFDDNINIKVMESKWSYNAMITASGMGGTAGVYQDVATIPTGCNTAMPNSPVGYTCIDLDDNVKLPEANLTKPTGSACDLK